VLHGYKKKWYGMNQKLEGKNARLNEGVWQARIDPRIKSEPLKKLAVKNYKNPEFKDAVAEMEKQGRLEAFLKLKDGIRS